MKVLILLSNLQNLKDSDTKALENLKSEGVYVLAFPLLPSCTNLTNLNFVQDHYSTSFKFENVKKDMSDFIMRLEDQC